MVHLENKMQFKQKQSNKSLSDLYYWAYKKQKVLKNGQANGLSNLTNIY